MEKNYFRLIILLTEIGARVLRKFLEDQWLRAGYSSFIDLLNQEQHKFYHCLHPGRQHPLDACCCKSNRESKSSMTPPQWDLLYEDTGCSTTCPYQGIHPCKYRPKPSAQLEGLDITLLRFIIDKLFPGNTALNNIRILRNDLIHSGTVRVSDADFQQKWSSARGDILKIANTSAAPFPKEIEQEIDKLENRSIDSSECDRVLRIFQLHRDAGNSLQVDMSNVESTVNSMKTQLDKVESKLVSVESIERFVKSEVESTIHSMESTLESLESTVVSVKSTVDNIIQNRNAIPQTTRNPVIQRRIENTKCVLESHRESLYVPFEEAEKAAYGRLQTENFVTISGRAGSGKTSLGKRLMIKYSDQYREDDGTPTYTPLILSKPEDFDLINCRDRLIIFMDDPFGGSNIDADLLTKWEKHFDCFLSFCKNGNVRIIIGVRSNLISEPETSFRNFTLFSKENMIDLSSTHKLTSTEKLQFLKAYCRKYKVRMCEGESVGQLEESSSGNIEMSDTDTSESNRINMSVLSEISELDPFEGFPLACSRFFSVPAFFDQGAYFFTHATQSLKNEISELEENVPVLYFTLLLSSLEGGEVDLDNVDGEKLRKMNEALNKNFTASNIKACVCSEKSKAYIEKNHGIPYENRGRKLDMRYQFTHQTVLESVLSSFCDRYPETLIRLSSCDIIGEFVRPQTYKPRQGEICVNVPSRCHSLLAERVVNNWGFWVFCYKGIQDESFAVELLDAMETHFTSPEKFNQKLFDLIKYGRSNSEKLYLCEVVCTCYKHNGQKIYPKKSFWPCLPFVIKSRKMYIALSTFLEALGYLSERTESDIDKLIRFSGLDLSCTYMYLDEYNKSKEMVPICYAAKQGLKHLVLYWLKKSGTLHNRNDLCLLLDEFCKRDWCDAFELLSQKNKDGKHREILSPWSVYQNASRGIGIRMVQYFSKSIIDMTLTDKSSNTLLHYCSKYGLKSEVLRILDKHPRIINAQNADGDTAIYLAAMHEEKDIVKDLLQHGADTSIKCNYDYTVLHLCAAYDWDDIIKQQVTYTTLLNTRNFDGFSPAHTALYFGNQKVLDILLQAGVNLQHKKFSCVALAVFGMLRFTHLIPHVYFAFPPYHKIKRSPEEYINILEFIFQQNSTMINVLCEPMDECGYTIIHICIFFLFQGNTLTTFLSHFITKYPDAARARNKTKLPTALHLAAYLGRYEYFVLLYDAGVRIADGDQSIEDTLQLGIQNSERSIWLVRDLPLFQSHVLFDIDICDFICFGRYIDYRKIEATYTGLSR